MAGSQGDDPCHWPHGRPAAARRYWAGVRCRSGEPRAGSSGRRVGLSRDAAAPDVRWASQPPRSAAGFTASRLSTDRGVGSTSKDSPSLSAPRPGGGVAWAVAPAGPLRRGSPRAWTAAFERPPPSLPRSSGVVASPADGAVNRRTVLVGLDLISTYVIGLPARQGGAAAAIPCSLESIPGRSRVSPGRPVRVHPPTRAARPAGPGGHSPAPPNRPSVHPGRVRGHAADRRRARGVPEWGGKLWRLVDPEAVRHRGRGAPRSPGIPRAGYVSSGGWPPRR